MRRRTEAKHCRRRQECRGTMTLSLVFMAWGRLGSLASSTGSTGVFMDALPNAVKHFHFATEPSSGNNSNPSLCLATSVNPARNSYFILCRPGFKSIGCQFQEFGNQDLIFPTSTKTRFKMDFTLSEKKQRQTNNSGGQTYMHLLLAWALRLDPHSNHDKDQRN